MDPYSATLALTYFDEDDDHDEQPPSSSSEVVADLQLLAADGSVRQALPLRVGANRVGRTAAQTDCVIDNPTVSVGHAVLDIAAQPASVSASSLSNPFFTARHTLLDLDCIHLTDLGSTNHTHLASSTFPRSLTAAPAPVRLSRNKPRLLHHGQYFFVGNQCCRFVLWKYEEGVALALKEKERRASVDTAASTQDVLGPEPGETQLMTIGDVDEDSPVEPGAAVVPSPVYTASGERAEQQRFATAYGRDDEGGFEPDFADDSNYQTLQSNDYEEDAVLAPAQAAPEGAVPVEEATSREPIAVDGGSQRRPVEEAVTGAGSEPTELSAASNSTPLDMTLPPSHPSQTDSTQDRLRGDRSLKAYDAGSEPGGLLSPNATQPLPAADVASDHGVVSTPSMGTLDGRKASARSRRQSPVEAASAKADEERRVAEERTRQEEDAHKRAEDAERLRKEADDTQRALDARREEMHRQEAAEQRRLSEDLQRKREAKEKERKEREDHTEAERVKREGQEENERQQAAHERRERKLREDTDEKEEEERQRQLQLKKQKEDSAQPAKKQQENQETEERDKREREEQKHLEFARQAEEVPKLEALKEQQRQHAATLTKQADWRPKPTKRLAMAAQNAADDGAAAPPTPRRGKRSAEDGSPERTKPAGGGKKRKGAGKAEKLAEERAAGVVDVLTPEVEDMREVEAVVQPPAPAVQPTSVRPDRRANATLRRSSRSRSAAHGTDGEDDDDAVAAQPITSTQFTTAHWRPIRPQQLASPPEPTAHPREDGSGQRQQPHQVESADTTDTDRTAASVPKGSEPLAKVEQLDNVDVAAVDDEKTKAVGSAAAEHEDGAPMELDQLPAFVGPDANVPRGLRSEKTQEALDVLDDMDTARALTSPFHGLTTVAEGDAVEPSSNRAVRGRKRKTAQKPAPEDDSPPEPSVPLKKQQRRRSAQAVSAATDEDKASSGAAAPSSRSHSSPPSRRSSSGARSSRLRTPTSKPSTPTQPHSTRRSISSAPVLLFTGMEPTIWLSGIEQLGGTITTVPSQATHLVSDRVRRTWKFLSAYPTAQYVVGKEWMDASIKAGSWLSPGDFTLRDAESEEKWKFTVVTRQLGVLILDGWRVWTTEHVEPDRAAMRSIVEASGGRLLDERPEESGHKLLVIGDEKLRDREECGEMSRRGITVYHKDVVLTSVLRQELKPDSPEFVLHPAAAANRARAQRGKRQRSR